jgi:NitT/TauT family transport system substrate-binding protein
MTIREGQMSRRQTLAGAGAGLVAATLGAATLGGARPAAALEPIRQGYQTNIWGMPTYYLMRSGLLKKHGLEFEEFAVPSGNITMQQMVARQVDLGTYAGPSLLIGNARGGVAAIAEIERVGKTIRVMGRKDLHLTTLEDLRGRKVANQTGSSVGNIFADELMPAHGLNKGDYQEVRMNVNDMVSALVAKTVDAMVNVEPYNAIAEDAGAATTIVDFSAVDPLPVFMAVTPEFAAKHPDTLVAYLKAWIDAGKDFKQQPDKVSDLIYSFYADKGYTLSRDTFKKALARVEVDPGFPPASELRSYMTAHAEALIKAKQIATVPDFDKIMLRQFMTKAEA